MQLLVLWLKFSGFNLEILLLIVFLVLISDIPFTYGMIQVIVSVGSLSDDRGGSDVISLFF